MTQILATSIILAVFGALFFYVVSGQAHRSAHPNGERPHFRLVIQGINRLRATDLLPRWGIFIGPIWQFDEWGLDAVWGLRESPQLGENSYDHGLQLTSRGRWLPDVRVRLRAW